MLSPFMKHSPNTLKLGGLTLSGTVPLGSEPNDPVEELKAGTFDLVPRDADTEPRSLLAQKAAAGKPIDTYDAMESRIDAFLGREGVHGVQLDLYLKAMGVHTESAKLRRQRQALARR